MAFSMHSHSGQFCPSYAQNTLEEMIQKAIALRMAHFALTEHMPGTNISDLYPEEITEFVPLHNAYLQEAVRLRAKYENKIKFLICFEGEWIRSDYGATIKSLICNPVVDFFIGSVRHVHTQAAQLSGGTEGGFFANYYDLQYEMLVELRPRVDLKKWEHVWRNILRSLELIIGYEGLIEVNSSGLRKGLGEPYPGRMIRLGSKFTLSDDSYCIAHVRTNYELAVEFFGKLGLNEVYVFERQDGEESHCDSSLKQPHITSVPISSVSFRAIVAFWNVS
ncbi:histidinol-phosphatase [Acephala macrosclerotiorum]|nr:histidinol-phosphatase [Acephala macrosclerotiorum]